MRGHLDKRLIIQAVVIATLVAVIVVTAFFLVITLLGMK